MSLTTIPADKIQLPLEGGFYSTPTVLTDSASVTPDFSVNNFFTWTISQDATLNFPSAVPGAGVWHIFVTQDSVGSHGISLAAGYHIIAGTLEDSPDAETIITVVSDGSGTDLDTWFYEQTGTALVPLDIVYSCRFNDNDSAFLSRTPATGGNRRAFTFSTWIKRGNLGSIQQIFNAGAGEEIQFTAADALSVTTAGSGAYTTTSLFRDQTAWYHIQVAVDTDLVLAADRIKIFVNGDRISNFSVSTAPTINVDTAFNNTGVHHLGSSETPAEYLDGYLSTVNLVDGLALSPENFGLFNSSDVWIPKRIDPTTWDTNELLFDRTAGTNIGGMIGDGGLAAAFDDTASQAATASASETAVASSFVGKSYGAGNGKTVTSYIVFPSNDLGFSTNANVTIQLYGSNTTPSNSTDGTLLHDSGSFADTTSSQTYDFVDINTTTPYLFHWVTVVPAATATNYIAEVQFYHRASYGQNGFFFDFTDNSTANALGTDGSGRGNDYTASGLSITDQLLESPTDNHATWLSTTGHTTQNASFSNGNLTITHSGTVVHNCWASIAVKGGKWKIRLMNNGVRSGDAYFGAIQESALSWSSDLDGITGCFTYRSSNGQANDGAIGSAYGNSWNADTDEIDMYLDLDNGVIWYSKNGTLQNGASQSEVENGTITNAAHSGLDITETYYIVYSADSGGVTTDFGQDDFDGDALFNGFFGLRTTDFSEPAITKPSDYFETVLYTGNATANRRLWRQDFKPDLVWIKNRDTTTTDHKLFDSVRGATSHLSSNDQNAEAAEANSLLSFDYQGFTLGNSTSTDVNLDGIDYVAWSWKKSASSGFDIKAYTGTGTSGLLVNHDLGAVPELMMIKNRGTGTTDWAVYHHGVNGGTNPEQYFGWLNSTNAFTNSGGTAYWNDATPSTTQFTLGNDTDVNASSNDYIAYLWRSITGFSKIGSYTGNGAADGPFVYLGFRPAWLLVKRAGTSASWYLHDAKRNSFNPVDREITINTNAAEFESGLDPYDFLANGIKINDNNNAWNAAANLYVYAAFAQDPFKTTRAR